MQIDLPAGKYVVAVSGGVDSVVLLHLLVQKMNAERRMKNGGVSSPLALVVAHFDHGIRSDSNEDQKLVRALAEKYGLPYVTASGNLGAGASEAVAREARYNFLHQVRVASGADAVVTAHHQDDAIETAVLNMLRGTGRRGLSSLKSTDVVKRPLLHAPKKQLRDYAAANGLVWREDSTNTDEAYLRNYVRGRIAPRLGGEGREQLLQIMQHAHALNQEIERHIVNYLHMQPGLKVLDRHAFILLPHGVAREVLAEWLRARTSVEVNKKMLERLVAIAKTGKAGSKTDIDAEHWLEISRKLLALTPRER